MHMQEANMLALASQGFTVHAPNTRGRGGYGMAFERGCATATAQSGFYTKI